MGLALAGGAARGFAHLGILDYLKENNYQPAALSGCSMGSIVASMAALGKSSEEIAALSQSFKFRHLISLTWPSVGLSSLNKMEAYLKNVFGEATFEDTTIPLYVVASDLDSGEEIVFDSGLIWQAVLASSAIPVIFEPYLWQGRRLVDGGLLRLNPAYCLKDKGLSAIIGTDIGLTRTKTGPVKGIGDYAKQCLELLARGQRQQSEKISDLTLKPAIRDKPFLNFSRLEEYREIGKKACLGEKNKIAKIFE